MTYRGTEQHFNNNYIHVISSTVGYQLNDSLPSRTAELVGGGGGRQAEVGRDLLVFLEARDAGVRQEGDQLLWGPFRGMQR